MSLNATFTIANGYYGTLNQFGAPNYTWYYEGGARIQHSRLFVDSTNAISSAVFPTPDQRTQLRAINNDQNITVDMVELWLPQADSDAGVNYRTRTMTVGSTTRQYSDITGTKASELVANNSTDVNGPAYNAKTGVWVQGSVAAFQAMLANESGLIIKPRGNGVLYAATGYPQIRVTYHYHNSEPSFSGDSCEFGSAVTVNLTTYHSGYTHKLVFSVGSSSSTVNLAAGVTSYAFTPPVAWISQLPNSVQGVLSVKATTYDGSTIIGDEPTAQIPINVPASVVPSPGSITYTVSNPLAVPITNRGLTASLSGQAGVYGSTIRSYTLQGEGFTSVNQNLVIDPIQRIAGQSQSRTLAVTATVTDSRGRSAFTTLNITVYEWDVPYFSALEYYRCNSYGTKSEDGGYLRIACTYACFPVTVGSTNKNSITAHTYKIVTKDGSTTIAQGTLSGSAQVVGGGNLSADEEYYLQLTLTDGVTTIVYQYLIYSSAYVIHFRNGGTGVAFGQAADANNTVKINPNWVLIIGNNIDVAAKLADLESRIAALEGN